MARRARSRIVLGLAAALVVIATAVVIYATRGGQRSPYITETVKRGNITEYVRARGDLAASSVVEISTQISGKIIAVYVKENQRVTKGQLLARVDPSTIEEQLSSAKSVLDGATAAQEFALKEEIRQRDMLAHGITTQQLYDSAYSQLKQAKAQTRNAQAAFDRVKKELERCDIVAEDDGIIISRKINGGETVQASFSAPMLFAIGVDPTKLRISAEIQEIDYPRVKQNQPVEFTVGAYPRRTFSGLVSEIRTPYISQRTQQQQSQSQQQQPPPAFTVVIDVDNADLTLFPGATAQVSIVVGTKQDVLVIPTSALRVKAPPTEPGDEPLLPRRPPQVETADLNTDVVYKSDGSRELPEAVWIKYGVTDDRSTEVISGLRESDQVVTAIDDSQQSRNARRSLF